MIYEVWDQGDDESVDRILADDVDGAAQSFIEQRERLEERDYAVLIRQVNDDTVYGRVVSVSFAPYIYVRAGFVIP